MSLDNLIIAALFATAAATAGMVIRMLYNDHIRYQQDMANLRELGRMADRNRKKVTKCILRVKETRRKNNIQHSRNLAKLFTRMKRIERESIAF